MTASPRSDKRRRPTVEAAAIRCPSCNAPNPGHANFCGNCGEALTAAPVPVCAHCAAEMPREARFCLSCGQPTGYPSLEAGLPTGERRHVTALFCDLVDSTPLSQRLDPEEFSAVIAAFQECCAAVVENYLGHVAAYLGDGILASFGYPHAHDNDAQLAVRAGLGIVEQLAQLNQSVEAEHGVQLAVRVGIHSGPVVVADMNGRRGKESPLLGSTINIAARFQSVAEPNSVVISGDTIRLVQGLFLVRDLGMRTLKGVAEPLAVYQVLHPSGVRSRLDLPGASARTPFVARRQELGMLLDRWEQVQEGVGQVILLCGDAGIGKSRLVQELRQQLAGTPLTWLECRCSDYTQNSALFPVIELQSRGFGFDADDAAAQKLEKLERAVETVDLDPAEVVPLFASLHSVPLPSRYATPALSADAQKRKTLEALAEWLLHLGELQSVLLLVEDLQWIDPSTQQLLGLVLNRIPTTKVLAIFTHRPEFTSPWPRRSHVTPMLLNRLTGAQAARLVAGVSGKRKLPKGVVQEIIRDSDGIPLFVEELAKSVMERGDMVRERASPYSTRPPTSRSIPDTLQDLLMARFDRVGPLKELAQFCAAVGRDFPYALLRAAYPVEESELRAGLGRLVEAELFYQRGIPPQATYIFRHALIREAAYQSLLKGRRRRYHESIAQALERDFPDTVAAQPELVAQHYTEAGRAAEAVGYWLQAGQRALERSANIEVVRHLDKGLELLEALPDTTERCQQEVAMRIVRGLALTAIKGYAAPDVQRNFARALEVCRAIGETSQLFLVLFGLYGFYLVHSERDTTIELSEQLSRFAEHTQDPDLLLEALAVAGVTAFWQGRHGEAQAHLRRALDLYDPERHGYHAYVYGHDPAAYARATSALSMWFSGYPDQALAMMHEALTHAERMAHPLTLAAVLNFAGDLHHYRREIDELATLAERGVGFSTEQGFILWANGGISSLGWVLVQRGDIGAGIKQIRESLAGTQATGAQINSPFMLSKLAAALLVAGEVSEGLAQVNEALALAQTNLDSYWEAELHRLRGELLACSSGDAKDTERCFQDGLEVARRQGAKSLELRVATSLSRLWQKQDQRDDARRLLSGVYGWFTEGFETGDLREARDLLAELG